MYYASIGMLSLAVLLIINFEALKASPQNDIHVAHTRYRHFLFAVMAYMVSDILWGFLYDQRWIIPTYADTVAFFVMMIVSVLLWTRFVTAYLENKGRFGKLLIGSGWLIVTFEIIALIINFFIPIFFGFNEEKEYVPGFARYITLFAQMILFLATSIYTLAIAIKAEGKEKAHHRTIGFSGIVMTIFIALQTLYPLLPLYAVGCLLATCMIHSFVYKDETMEHSLEMGTAKRMAYRDPLTGVKNKLSYLEALRSIETRLESGELKSYGVVVFDINGLKQVNDTQGHEAGDEYIRNGCSAICMYYKHSPVFRIGGDEFTVILEGEDYANREELILAFDEEMNANRKNGLVVVSSGMDIYRPGEDHSYNDVFKRADKKMYEKKERLKTAAS